MNFDVSSLDLSRYADLMIALAPELLLTVAALAVLLVLAWRHRSAADLRLAGWVTLVGLGAAGAAAWFLWWNRAHATGLATMIAVDDFRFVTDWLFLGTAALTVLVSRDYLERERLLAPEYYALLLFATLGMMLMAGAEDLMVLFLGLELMSVSVYVLAGINRHSAPAAEAALKYFLLGAFASAFLLYGIALVYGATATTNLTLIGVQVTTLGLAHSPMLLIGLGLLLVGFGFKVAAVPFHMWAPDVYDGAPTPVTGYMATAVKAAAFAALFRVLGEAFGAVPAWHAIVWWLAVVTMLVGNLIALTQRTVKRMLAYSSIAHAGYLLVAVATGTATGAAAFIFYLVAYTLMTLAAFALLAAKGRDGERAVTIDDLGGLAARRPWLALALAVCMLSLLGFPGTAGFIGKWYILVAATAAGQGLLAAILVLATVISAGYYLPVIMAMYMKPEPAPEAHAAMRLGPLASAVVFASVAGLLFLGVQPNLLLDLAQTSGASVRAASAVSSRAAPAALPAPATPVPGASGGR
jgi:NADH-quinone oxidoreductase subunit N